MGEKSAAGSSSNLRTSKRVAAKIAQSRGKKDQNDIPTGLSAKVRSLRKLLNHHVGAKLPADVRQEKERELAGYLADLERREKNSRRSAMIKKYHKIRFLERQKATRRVKRLEKELASSQARGSKDDDVAKEPSMPDPSSSIQVREELSKARVDLNYALFFPLEQNYISLYSNDLPLEAQDLESQSQWSTQKQMIGRTERQRMWNIVKTCMENDTLDKLRNGQITTATQDPQASHVPLIVSGKSSRKKQKLPDGLSNLRQERTLRASSSAPSGDESAADGGFFER